MAFRLITPKNTRDVRNVPRSSLAVTSGAMYRQSVTTGATELAVATTTANQVLFVANETLASGSTPFSGTIASKEDEFLVDTVNNSNAAHNGQRMILDATGLLLNNTGTDVSGTTGVFQQVAVVGAAADRKIIARRV